MSLIGQPLTRREDPALLTGRGRYVGDFSPQRARCTPSSSAAPWPTPASPPSTSPRPARPRASPPSSPRPRSSRPGRRRAPWRREPAARRAEPGAPGARQRQGPVPSRPADRPGRRRHSGTRRRRRRARGRRLRRPSRGHRRPGRRGRRRAALHEDAPGNIAFRKRLTVSTTPPVAFQHAAYTVSQRMTSQRLCGPGGDGAAAASSRSPADDGRIEVRLPTQRPRRPELAREGPRDPPGSGCTSSRATSAAASARRAPCTRTRSR